MLRSRCASASPGLGEWNPPPHGLSAWIWPAASFQRVWTQTSFVVDSSHKLWPDRECLPVEPQEVTISWRLSVLICRTDTWWSLLPRPKAMSPCDDAHRALGRVNIPQPSLHQLKWVILLIYLFQLLSLSTWVWMRYRVDASKVLNGIRELVMTKHAKAAHLSLSIIPREWTPLTHSSWVTLSQPIETWVTLGFKV